MRSGNVGPCGRPRSRNDAAEVGMERKRRSVVAGDPPAARGAPGMHPWVGALAVPKLGGKLPPRTAKLAVPPGSICMVPVEPV